MTRISQARIYQIFILLFLTAIPTQAAPSWLTITVYEDGQIAVNGEMDVELEDLFADSLAGEYDLSLSLNVKNRENVDIHFMIKGRLSSLPETPWDYEEVLFGVGGSAISFTVNRRIEDYYEETHLIAHRAEGAEAVYDTEGPWLKIVFGYRNGTVNPDELRKRALEILRGGAAKAAELLAEREATDLAVTITELTNASVRARNGYYELYVTATATVSLKPEDYPGQLAETVRALDRLARVKGLGLLIWAYLNTTNGEFVIRTITSSITGDACKVLAEAQPLAAELIKALSADPRLVMVRAPVTLNITRKAAEAAANLLNLTLSLPRSGMVYVVRLSLSQESLAAPAKGRLTIGGLKKQLWLLSPQGINSSSEVLGLLGKGLAPLVSGSLNVTLMTMCSGKPRYALPDEPKPVRTGENYVEWNSPDILPRLGEVKITVQVSAEEAGGKGKAGGATMPGWLPIALTAAAIAVAATMVLLRRRRA